MAHCEGEKGRRPVAKETDMQKRKWRVTAYETVLVTREYVADSEDEAVQKMSKWTKAREWEDGREFSGTVRVSPSIGQ
jgi:hypothetical protein